MPYYKVSASNVEEGRKLLSSGKKMGIRVHSEHCGACQQMAPVWEKVKKAAEKSPRLTLVDITGEAAAALSSKFPILNVDGYPTILNRAGQEYDGSREETTLLSWLHTSNDAKQFGGKRRARTVKKRKARARRVGSKRETKRALRTKRRRS